MQLGRTQSRVNDNITHFPKEEMCGGLFFPDFCFIFFLIFADEKKQTQQKDRAMSLQIFYGWTCWTTNYVIIYFIFF